LGEKAMETFKMLKDVAELLFSKLKSWKPTSPLMSKTHGNVKYENMDWTKKPFLINTRICVCKVANILGISMGPVQSILKGNLNMCQIAAILPRLQSEIHLLVNFCLKTKDHHSTTPLITRFSIVSLVSFPKTQDGVKGKKI
jgi:hypothetical protein